MLSPAERESLVEDPAGRERYGFFGVTRNPFLRDPPTIAKQLPCP
jgi:hypothetical protein